MPPAESTSFWNEYPSAVSSILHFLLSGGIFMALIGLCSLLAVTVILWKALVLRKDRIVPDDLAHTLESAPVADLSAVSLQAADDDSVLGNLSHLALAGRFHSKDEARDAVEAVAREEVVKLETGIPALEVVITISPLLGLLGTVKGLVSVFSTIGAGGSMGGDPAGIALGIAEALNTTIAGLAVAVPTVVAHAYFAKKVERFAVRMEVIVGRLIAARFAPADARGTVAPVTARSA